MEGQFQKTKKWLGGVSMKSISYERQGIKPSHDWMILLVVTVILISVTGGASYYLYARIGTDTLFPAMEDVLVKEETVNSVLFQKTISSIDAKAATTTLLRVSKNTPPDPSL